MSNEDKEKPEEAKSTVATRLDIPGKVHDKIVKHQYRMIGKSHRKVTLKDAAIDLLIKATRSIKTL